MKKSSAIATLLIASYALSTGAWGQTVYRCGANYSQTPCPGAVTVEAGDARSPQQKVQADKAIARDMATANALEKARLQEETRATASSIADTQRSKTKTAKAKSQTKKKKAPEFFTAKAAAEKKK